MARAGLTENLVVAEAERMADEVGLANVTMAALAQRLGVRQPSLYKHVASLPALRRAIGLRTTTALTEELARAAVGRSGDEALLAMARAFREWVKAHPGRYQAGQRAPDRGDTAYEAAAAGVLELFGSVLSAFDLTGDDTIDAIRSPCGQRCTGSSASSSWVGSRSRSTSTAATSASSQPSSIPSQTPEVPVQTHDTTHPRAVLGPAAAVESVSFLAELAMLALLAVTGARLGAGTLALDLALAILLPLSAASIWSVWMAPRSSRRLADPGRLFAQVALFAATGLLAGLAGLATLGIAFAVTATVLFALTRIS